MTPDGDEYEEALDSSQPGPHRICMLGLDGSPPRLLRDKFYRFTEHPTDEQLVRKAVEHFRAQAHASTPQPPLRGQHGVGGGAAGGRAQRHGRRSGAAGARWRRCGSRRAPF
ncbi:unnamed protein product [Prorocentrum cordatum]|uniref:Uncharacterized protein n=1 Tax=Prorocentrum cordatum TaxID=2364126 RepID=A0ABN9X4C8_9DINO|nr:unnamed protein product [Polarella glacialis]